MYEQHTHSDMIACQNLTFFVHLISFLKVLKIGKITIIDNIFQIKYVDLVIKDDLAFSH